MKILYLPNEYSQQRQRQKKACIFPILMAMQATYRKKKGDEVTFNPIMTRMDPFSFEPIGYDQVITKPEGIPFELLGAPDRELTGAFDPKWQKNGNFKHLPGAYTMAAGGCWYGGCTFCVEKGEPYSVRSVDSMMEEIAELQELDFREIFDDSATFPDGAWLREFCLSKIELGLDIPFSCNMRIGADVDFELMKRANFRMLLYGIESANQKTLDKLNKGVDYEQIIPTIKQAAEADLSPHVAIMLRCPGEDNQDTDKTIELVHYLLRKGFAKTAQASVYNVEGQEYCRKAEKDLKRIYDVAWSPEFWFNKLSDLKSWDDVKYLMRGIREGLK